MNDIWKWFVKMSPYISAVISFLIGWTLVILAFYTHPVGEVHQSIQWILGQALLYCASVLGVVEFVKQKIK